MLQLQVKMDLGGMAMKKHSIFPQSSKAGTSPSDGLMSYLGGLLEGGVLSICSDAVGEYFWAEFDQNW